MHYTKVRISNIETTEEALNQRSLLLNNSKNFFHEDSDRSMLAGAERVLQSLNSYIIHLSKVERVVNVINTLNQGEISALKECDTLLGRLEILGLDPIHDGIDFCTNWSEKALSMHE